MTVRIAVLLNGFVDSIQTCELDLPDGSVPVIVGEKVEVNVGDIYLNGVFSINPDAAKLQALKDAKEAAIAALTSADGKAAVLKALADAEAAVQPLEDVVKP